MKLRKNSKSSRNPSIAKAFIILSLFSFVSCSPILQNPKPGSQADFHQNGVSDCPLAFSQVALCGQLAPLQKPLQVGKLTTFRLAFWHKDLGNFTGPYVDPGLIPDAWLWMKMPAGDHGSRAVTVSSAIDSKGGTLTGLYDVDQVFFSMPSGSREEWWEIHVELKKSDGTVVDAAVQRIFGI